MNELVRYEEDDGLPGEPDTPFRTINTESH